MKTDTGIIESFLLQEMDHQERESFAARRNSDFVFRKNLIAQTKVHLAALLYGRNLRRAQILAAGERAFADPQFSQQVSAIFR